MYFPMRNTCARMLSSLDSGLRTYALAARHQLAPGTDMLGTVRGISVETGATTWLYEQRAATWSLVATGGGLVFGGDVNGRFRAFDTGYPISFAAGGRQSSRSAPAARPSRRPSSG